MDNQPSAGLTFVFFETISGGLRARDPSFASALQRLGEAVETLLSGVAGTRLFSRCSFSATDRVDVAPKQGWDLGVACFLDGNMVASYSLADCFLAGSPSSSIWAAVHYQKLGPLAVELAQQLRASEVWRQLPDSARATLLSQLSTQEARAAVRELKQQLVEVVAADEALLRCLPAALRGAISRLQQAGQELDSSLPEEDAVVVLLESTIESLKIAAPKASSRLPPASAAKLAALLEDLQAAEQLAPTPLGALQGLLAFLVMHAWSAQGVSPMPPRRRLLAALGAANPWRLLRGMVAAAASLRLPTPNRVARGMQLRGEVLALTLVEGALDVWGVCCKMTDRAAQHARHAVRPALLMLVTHRLHATLQHAQQARARAGQREGALREGMQQDLLDAIQEAREGLITDDMVEEKRRMSAAILRRLDREAYDRMTQYMAFDMANEINLHQGADSGESEDIGRWDEVQAQLYDWFYVMSRFGKNAHELAGRIKTYPQDLDHSALSFNGWVQDIITSGTKHALPLPDEVNDKHDTVDQLCASPAFRSLDPLQVKAGLSAQAARGSAGKQQLLKTPVKGGNQP